MRFQGFFNIKNMQNPNCGRWKTISFVDPVLGSLVYQVLEGITLAYDLHFGTIARWKGIVKKKYFLGQIKSFGYHWGVQSKKNSFRPSIWPYKFMNQKPAENSKLLESYFSQIGIDRWPPISTWINPPSLGSNGLHCVEWPGEHEKCLFNLHLEVLGDIQSSIETFTTAKCFSLQSTKHYS